MLMNSTRQTAYSGNAALRMFAERFYGLMEISNEQRSIIEQESAALQPSDYLRLNMSYDDFVAEYSGLLGQATQDSSALSAAGFDMSSIVRCYGYLEMLTTVHTERVLADSAPGSVRSEFNQRMPVAQADRRILMAAIRFIELRRPQKELERICKAIRKGSTQVDILSDNLVLTGIIRKHMDLAAQIRPGGVSIDEMFLGKVEKDAFELLKLKGIVNATDSDTRESIDMQNRLITLCIRAQREIKLFAEFAFYNDLDYYNRYYTSATARAMNRSAARKAESVEAAAPPVTP